MTQVWFPSLSCWSTSGGTRPNLLLEACPAGQAAQGSSGCFEYLQRQRTHHPPGTCAGVWSRLWWKMLLPVEGKVCVVGSQGKPPALLPVPSCPPACVAMQWRPVWWRPARWLAQSWRLASRQPARPSGCPSHCKTSCRWGATAKLSSLLFFFLLWCLQCNHLICFGCFGRAEGKPTLKKCVLENVLVLLKSAEVWALISAKWASK